MSKKLYPHFSVQVNSWVYFYNLTAFYTIKFLLVYLWILLFIANTSSSIYQTIFEIYHLNNYHCLFICLCLIYVRPLFNCTYKQYHKNVISAFIYVLLFKQVCTWHCQVILNLYYKFWNEKHNIIKLGMSIFGYFSNRFNV